MFFDKLIDKYEIDLTRDAFIKKTFKKSIQFLEKKDKRLNRI